jgi:hypothetical protein
MQSFAVVNKVLQRVLTCTAHCSKPYCRHKICLQIELHGCGSAVAIPSACKTAGVPALPKALLQMWRKSAPEARFSEGLRPLQQTFCTWQQSHACIPYAVHKHESWQCAARRKAQQSSPRMTAQATNCVGADLQAAIRRLQCMQETSSRACWLTTWPNTSSTGACAFFPGWYCKIEDTSQHIAEHLKSRLRMMLASAAVCSHILDCMLLSRLTRGRGGPAMGAVSAFLAASDSFVICILRTP